MSRTANVVVLVRFEVRHVDHADLVWPVKVEAGLVTFPEAEILPVGAYRLVGIIGRRERTYGRFHLGREALGASELLLVEAS